MYTPLYRKDIYRSIYERAVEAIWLVLPAEPCAAAVGISGHRNGNWLYRLFGIVPPITVAQPSTFRKLRAFGEHRQQDPA